MHESPLLPCMYVCMKEEVEQRTRGGLVLSFIDYTIAIDMIAHDSLFKNMVEMEFRRYTIPMMKVMYDEQKPVVRATFGRTGQVEL